MPRRHLLHSRQDQRLHGLCGARLTQNQKTRLQRYPGIRFFNYQLLIDEFVLYICLFSVKQLVAKMFNKIEKVLR